MAYRYSNELLGYESLGDTTCLMRADDAAIDFTSSPTIHNYRNVYYGLFSKVTDDRMVETEINSNIEGSFLFYAPAVLGMTFARLLDSCGSFLNKLQNASACYGFDTSYA
jgi:hypothetical protein